MNAHTFPNPTWNNDSTSANLSADDRAAILGWLARIGETDQAVIECTLEKCRTDVDALDYFLWRARG